MSRSLWLSLAVLAVVATVVSGGCPSYNTSLVGFNFPGFNLYQVAASSVADCSAACCATTTCQAFTFNTAATTHANCTAGQGCCQLKFQRGDAIASTATNIVSGFIVAPNTTAVYVSDQSIQFNVAFYSNLGNLTTLATLVLLDVSINIATHFDGVNASVILPYLRLSPVSTYRQSGSNNIQFTFIIASPIYSATGITPLQYAIALESQVFPFPGTGNFSAPNSNVTLPNSVQWSMTGANALPSPAVLGAPVYDAQITLAYSLGVHPTNNNMSLWLSQIVVDLAVNIAFLTNVSNVHAMLPFITIQSPAANTNPATLFTSTGVNVRQYSLTFTLSAYITTVTGPYWTPDVLQQGFAYLAASDNGADNIVLFVPFRWSGISIVHNQLGSAVTDIPTATGSTGLSQPACQYASDVTVIMQATFTSTTVGSANSTLFIELIQQDIAWMLAQTADADPGTVGYVSGYATVNASAFLPYIQVVWPYLNNDVSPAVIESYSPAYSNGTAVYQPFTNKTAIFFIKFNVLAGASCILDDFDAVGIVQETITWQFADTPVFKTPNAMLQVSLDALHKPLHQPVVLSGLPLCASTVTPPSCSFQAPTSSLGVTSGTVSIAFVMSLGFPIRQTVDFNLKLKADLALSLNQPQLLLSPYITIVYYDSSTMDHTVVVFWLHGSVSALGVSADTLASYFISQAAIGNVTLPTIAYWYGVSVPTQSVSALGVADNDYSSSTAGNGGGQTGMEQSSSSAGQSTQCAPAYDATVTYLATFTNATQGSQYNGTFITMIQQDILQQLVHAAISLNASGVINTVQLQSSVQVVWPYQLINPTDPSHESIVSYSPTLDGLFSPFLDTSAWFYVKFNLLHNATCLLGGLSAVSVAEAYFNGMTNGDYVSPVTQLLVSTSAQVQQVVLSGLPLCAGTSAVGCGASAPFTLSSSTGSLLTTSVGYPVGSEAIVFFVVIGTIDASFTLHIQEDIAVNLANITGVSAELLLTFVVVTNVNGSATLNTGARRLLQSSHVSVSFVLLGTVSALSTSNTPINASALSQGFSNKAAQGTLQTPATGASAPAQNVSTSSVGGESSSSSSTGGLQATGTNGAAGGSAMSVFTLLVALFAAAALLL